MVLSEIYAAHALLFFVEHVSLSGFPIDFKVNYASEEEVVYFTLIPVAIECALRCIQMETCLMKGPFDDHLKWPLRGKITIQIVNQDGDHDHVEMTIPYNDKTADDTAGRVTDKERAKGGERQNS